MEYIGMLLVVLLLPWTSTVCMALGFMIGGLSGALAGALIGLVIAAAVTE